MYLAPLNYDRFFKKVFSHIKIAKQFLEDFLEVTISDIALLDKAHFLTDTSSKVEFDFRCTIDGNDVIIDMQQWYKTDVVRRFYTYHTAGTVLQLERLNSKQLPISTIHNSESNATHKTDENRTKNYNELKPVITIIWMVDDTLQFAESAVGYTMTPEDIMHFIRNKEIWTNPQVLDLLTERNRLLKILNNDTKDLDFLSKNRLVFLFQPNIVSDSNLKKYYRWFRFAAKTRNNENKESDFDEYTHDPIFKQIMYLIAKSKLSKEELDYIVSEEEKQIEIERYFASEHQMRVKEERRAIKREYEKIIEEKDNKLIEKDNKLKEKDYKLKENDLKLQILKLHLKGNTIEKISEITSKSHEYINRIIEE